MDYYSLPTLVARVKQAYGELVAAGATREQAQSLVALSISETSALWVVGRQNPMWYDNICWPTSSLVGLELGEPIWKRDAAGNVVRDEYGVEVIDVRVLMPSAVTDAQSLAFLTGNGYIIPLPKEKEQYMKKQRRPWYIPAGMFAGAGTPPIRYFFERVLDWRKGALLDNFSIGPTMRYLAFTKMAAEAGSSPTGNYNASWPNTWDDLFNVYMARTAGAQLKYFEYLSEAKTGALWPAKMPNDRPNAVKWLRQQVGSDPAKAGIYYDANLKKNLALVISNT